MGLSCLSMKTLKNHDWMELSWANNVYNTELSVETRLDMVLPEKIHIYCENNVLHTIFTITAYKAFLGHI